MIDASTVTYRAERSGESDSRGERPGVTDESVGVYRAARINEADCIGCTLCIKACPVDAIVGAARRMHSVVEAWCTGCALCVPPCPVDCIVLEPVAPLSAWGAEQAERALARHEARAHRQARMAQVARAIDPAQIVQGAIERARLNRERRAAAQTAQS